jgi:glycosyltransferase involved in cell wall biosynthesis
MKVLHVVASRERRGAEVFASSLVAALGRQGVDQRVAALRANDGPIVPFSVPVVQLGVDGGLPRIRLDPGAALRLRRLARRLGPDVIQAHGGEALKYVMASTVGRGRGVIYRRIGDSGQFRAARTRERLFATVARRAARTVAVADALRVEAVHRYGLDPRRVVTIPNAIDPASVIPARGRTAVREELGITEDDSVVLSLGALTWEKDPLKHVDVVARAAVDRPITHVLVGDGPLRADVERALSQRNGAYRGLLLGSRADVADLLAAVDVALVASRTEGMPASVIEAGAAGLPVVGFAVSGIPEVVVDGETGRLVTPGNAPGLSKALADLLDDPDLRASMGARARERCLERFDIDVVAPRYAQVYEEVAAR